MIDYVFTKAHKLDRVQYNAGDEIQRTARMGDWLVSQGIPLRRKNPAAEVSAPRPAPGAPVPRAALSTTASPRWCCGGSAKSKQ